MTCYSSNTSIISVEGSASPPLWAWQGIKGATAAENAPRSLSIIRCSDTARLHRWARFVPATLPVTTDHR